MVSVVVVAMMDESVWDMYRAQLFCVDVDSVQTCTRCFETRAEGDFACGAKVDRHAES